MTNSPNTTDKTITLPDGRALGYAEYGNSAGKPIFHFHGWPGSRLETQLFAKAATKFDVRLIGVDRPGMGLSDFQPGRKLTDWPDDVTILADVLGIGSFGVQGMSGGGPYASVCAYKIPDRLTTCGIISGIGPTELGTKGMMPINRVTFFVARWFPWMLKPALWSTMGQYSQDREKMAAAISKTFKAVPESDQKLIHSPEIKEILVAGLCEAFRQGGEGPAYDGKLYGHFWGFPLEEIAFENVHLWHGEDDVNVPVAMARGVARAIPTCQATYYANAGHFMLDHLDEIMTAMVA